MRSERRWTGSRWQKREAINEAILGGRAVNDESLALLAAEWAAERQRQTVRLYFGVLGPLCAVVVGILLWLLTRNDPEGGLGGAMIAGITALGSWRSSSGRFWRPLVRAEQANLAVAGAGALPLRREPSHWVIAWLVAWPIAAVIGVLFRAAGVTTLAGPIGLVVWFARRPRRGGQARTYRLSRWPDSASRQSDVAGHRCRAAHRSLCGRRLALP